MIIPYVNYEIILSSRFYFAVVTMIIYLIVAFPGTNKYIGSHLGLHDYDDVTSNDRYYLLMIHSFAMGFLTYVSLLIYNLSARK